MLAKLKITVDSKFTRFFFGRTGSFVDVSASTGGYPLVAADIFGDWREEVIMRKPDNTALRIYMSCIPTQYRLPTLMHDSQYRTCVAAENVAYNQVPHTSYYIGSLALAEDENNNKLNYLNPNTPYTNVEMTEKDNSIISILHTGISDDKIEITLNSRADMTADIILAEFDENSCLKNMNVKTQDLNKYGNSVLFENTVINDNCTYRIFMWDNVKTMCPLGNSYIINRGE